MNAADWVLSQPWAITEESLQTILAIAERRNEAPEAVEARLGRPLDNTREAVVRDGVALIPMVGPIARYADLFAEISGATSIDALAKDFRTALDDRSVRAIVLNVDSPGGTVAGVAEFAGHVLAARGGGKPIVSYVGSRAQSAGYWIASAADAVVADPTALLGSIGVIMGARVKDGSSKTVEFVSSQSPHKRADPATESGKAQIQATADDLADVFVDAVAAHRGVPRQKVLADFGRGSSLVGAKAVAAGMADAVGSLEQVIAQLSRGELPRSPSQAAATRGRTQEPAMSEPDAAPAPGDQAEIDRLRRMLAEAQQQKADADARASRSLDDAIAARADAFVAEMTGEARRATPAERDILRRNFIQAARDDADHPVAGSRTLRQDAFRALLDARPPHKLTTEKGSGDPAERTRALAEDPAAEADDADAEGSGWEAEVREHAEAMNGRRRK